MDIEDLFKITKKLDTKKIKKFGIWSLLIGFVLLIIGLILIILLFGTLINSLNHVFNFGVLGQWVKDFINSFIPGFVR